MTKLATVDEACPAGIDVSIVIPCLNEDAEYWGAGLFGAAEARTSERQVPSKAS